MWKCHEPMWLVVTLRFASLHQRGHYDRRYNSRTSLSIQGSYSFLALQVATAVLLCILVCTCGIHVCTCRYMYKHITQHKHAECTWIRQNCISVMPTELRMGSWNITNDCVRHWHFTIFTPLHIYDTRGQFDNEGMWHYKWRLYNIHMILTTFVLVKTTQMT